MNTVQIANQLVTHLKQGNFEGAQLELFHTDVVSVEPAKSDLPHTEGLEAILAKGANYWINLALAQGQGREVGFKLLKR